MRNKLYPQPILIGARRDENGRPTTIYPGPIHDAEAFLRKILDETLHDWGMYLTDEEYDDSLCDLIERCLKLEKRYEPDRSPSFAGYAKYILTLRVVDVAPRQWLGRTGHRIAERSHEELDEQTLTRSRPHQTQPEEQSNPDPHWGPDTRRIQTERNRRTAWAATQLGLRKAS